MAGSVLLKSLPSGEVLTTGGSGELYAAGPRQVYVYARGTTTQVPVYSDSALTTTLGQPLITGADGTPGGLPGYVASGQSIDVVDVLTGARTQAEPLLAGSLQGAVGATGPTGPAGVGANWRGVWSSGTTYAVGDGVSRNTRPYVGNSASNLNHDPATDTGANWTPIVTGPDGWYDVKAVYGAKGDGVTDDSAAIQAAITAARAVGGTVYFPLGTYMYGTTLSVPKNGNGITITSPSPVLSYAQGGAKLVYTGAAATGFNIHSCDDVEISNLAFQYSNAGFTGDLIDIDGNPLAADVINVYIHQCGSGYTGGTIGNARSIVRMNKVIISTLELCHWTGAVNSLRLGDPGGAYVNVVQIEKCSFNFASNAHILIGTGDGESITIRDCTFEAGTATTAIRGTTIAVDGGANALYNPIIEGNWFGDASGAVKWIDSLMIQSAPGYSGLIAGNRFAGGGVGMRHLILHGRWIVQNNSFENGTVYTCATTNNGLRLIAIGNLYGSPAAVFDPTTFPSGYPASYYVAIGEGPDAATRPEIYLQNKLGIHASGATLGSSTVDGNMIVGARSNAGYETPINASIVMSGYRPGSTAPATIIQSPWNGSHGEILLGTGATPTTQIQLQDGTNMGFYGATPVAQASRAGQLTDSTGGSVTSTLAAGITDTVAKNAIASLAAKVNALETIIHNLGLSA